MRNAGGYAVIVSPEPQQVTFDHLRCEQVGVGTTEADTFTCAHCNRIIHVRPRAAPDEFGSMCRNCMKMVCPDAACNKDCIPFMKRIEQAEKKDMMRRLNAQWI
jgi:hypothetical protein